MFKALFTTSNFDSFLRPCLTSFHLVLLLVSLMEFIFTGFNSTSLSPIPYIYVCVCVRARAGVQMMIQIMSPRHPPKPLLQKMIIPIPLWSDFGWAWLNCYSKLSWRLISYFSYIIAKDDTIGTYWLNCWSHYLHHYCLHIPTKLLKLLLTSLLSAHTNKAVENLPWIIKKSNLLFTIHYSNNA